MFGDFNFATLDDPDFKEDSVREELIIPLIKFLGYQASGDSRVIRSKKLEHPFVSIGSARKNICIVPDYLFLSEGKPYWILDAKAPNEEITKSKHVEQAYSYAIHSEVRAELYALCNGREFSLFSTRRNEPILHFKLSEIGTYLEPLHRLLNSQKKGNPALVDYLPDYGLWLRMHEVSDEFEFIGLSVGSCFIGKAKADQYIFDSNIPGNIEFKISFEMNEQQLKKLLSLIPGHLAEKISSDLSVSPFFAQTHEPFYIGVCATISPTISHNYEESWVSFNVEDFMPAAVYQFNEPNNDETINQ